MAGFSPDGSQALVKNAGSIRRTLGWDFTASAPKSFSTLWSQADKTDRLILQNIHKHAVEETIDYMEQNAAYTRTGKGGKYLHSASLVVAVFDHYSSRSLEPHVHSHCLVMNIGIAENKINAVHSPILYAHKMTLGAVYRASLAWHLEHELGIPVERRGDFFEIQGVPMTLQKSFSSRREVIHDTMENQGWHSAKAAAKVTLSTRSAKHEVSPEILLAQWRMTGQALGFGYVEATRMLHNEHPVQIQPQGHDEVLTRVMERFVRLHDFQEKDIIRAIAIEAPGRRLSVSDIKAIRDEFLRNCQVSGVSNLCQTRYVLDEQRYVNRPALKQEEYSIALSADDEDLEVGWEY